MIFKANPESKIVGERGVDNDWEIKKNNKRIKKCEKYSVAWILCKCLYQL